MIGCGGAAKYKAVQIESVSKYLEENFGMVPVVVTVYREASCPSTTKLCQPPACRCNTHKCKHVLEAAQDVVLEKKVQKALKTLHTALCPEATVSTTRCRQGAGIRAGGVPRDRLCRA